MERPELILFDYGETLFTETQHGWAAGHDELLRRATRNPRQVTGEEVANLERELWQELAGKDPDCCHEFHHGAMLRYLNDYFGLEFELSPQQQEAVLWEACSPGVPVPHIEELLRLLWERGIRTGVISNLSFTEKSLRDRVEGGLPGHHFELLISSMEYGVRKPSRRLFELALRKTDVAAERAWFCGNDPVCDVEGAANAGLRAFWYTGTLRGERRLPRCAYTELTDWAELIELLS